MKHLAIYLTMLFMSFSAYSVTITEIDPFEKKDSAEEKKTTKKQISALFV